MLKKQDNILINQQWRCSVKKIIIPICLLFALGTLRAQTQQGTWELSLSGHLGSVSISSESGGPYGTSSSSSESHTFLSLTLRPGLYILDHLALEPEVLWTAIEDEFPSFSLSGNLSYNFAIPDSRVVPFILAGYGVGNTIPLFQRALFRYSDKLDISVLNLGTGLKIFLAERAALRVEYRYQRYSQEQSYSYGYTSKTTEGFHNVFFGFSVFLP
jgi:hypothetical protein